MKTQQNWSQITLPILAFLVAAFWISAEGATVTWIGGSGDWNTATNWSTGTLPGTGDDVVIGSGPAITVTHSSGAHTVASIQSQQAFVLSGGVLTVYSTFQENNTFTLAGGTLQSATVTMLGGASLIVNGGGTLDGVTVNGLLAVGNAYPTILGVTNGLTLNGTALLGSPTNGNNDGIIYFYGSQMLRGNGTVVFGTSTANGLGQQLDGSTLTIGPGIVVRGQNGNITYNTGSVINQGTISADVPGGTILIYAQPFINQGLVQGINGCTLNVAGNWNNSGTLAGNGGIFNLSGNWTNSGTINVSNEFVGLGGTITLPAASSVFTGSGSQVQLQGVLNNSNNTLVLNGAIGSWLLAGGTIRGGTIVTTNGAALMAQGGMLDGVTVNGLLAVGNAYPTILGVTNGLTLNGTALLGSPTNGNNDGIIYFYGSQMLRGNGTVVFGTSTANGLGQQLDGSTLTIGPGIVVRGQNGNITYNTGSVINQGTISADVPGGTILIYAQPFINQGLVQGINGCTLNVAGNWNNSGTLAGNGGIFNLSGNWTNSGTINVSNEFVGLGGTITLPAASSVFTGSGSQVQLQGVLNNSNNTLVLNGAIGSWLLAGGTIRGGTIVTTNGAALMAQGGMLDGVTVNGLLAVGNAYPTILGVTNGLTLNGTALLGSPTNGNNDGIIYFYGSQMLRGNGTVVFGTSTANGLGQQLDGSTLTIGPGIVVRGQNGNITYNTGSVINQGTISADVPGGTILIYAQPFINQGLVQGINGCTLNVAGNWNNSGTLAGNGGIFNLSGNWTNSGTINVSNEFVGLGGTITLPAASSVFTGSGSQVQLQGVLNNSNNTLVLNGAIGSWLLAGGTIRGGTIVTTNGAALMAQGGMLDGVTVNGLLAVGNAYPTILGVTNGLTLNGTALLGSPTNGNNDGIIYFYGSQMLRGNGTVVFGTSTANGLGQQLDGSTLTIGPGIVVRGQNGNITYNTGSVINQGTISADVPGGTILIYAQSFLNEGEAQAHYGSTLNFQSGLQLDGNALISSQAGAEIYLAGNILGNTRNASQYAPLGTLEFTSGFHLLEGMSQDRGNVANGYVNNFAYGTILLDSGAIVDLADDSTNSAGPRPECVYVNSLIVSPGATLNLNGLHLYARLSQITGVVTNGNVSRVPTGGGALTLNTSTGGSISTVGTLDGWTFLGRAGEHVTVTADTGSANVVAPKLNYASVQLFDPSMNLLAQASNTISQQIVTLLNETLPVDGTYTVVVGTPANQPAATGNYLLTVWDITSNPQPLAVNQLELGQITTPYSGNQWNFSGISGEQIQFDLINESASGIAFTLAGPNGWVGFSNLASSSGLITLPYDGSYSLDAFGTGDAYGVTYAFEMLQSAQTNLMEGESFTGTFVGNGQPQLLAITVTNSGPLLITLNNAGAGNVTELYAQFGVPPTRGTFGWESINPNSPNQQILIPNAIAGIYYVLVYGNLIATPGAFTVQAVGADVFLLSANPNLGPNNANVTLTLNGGGFLPSTAVALISSSGMSFSASSVSVASFTQITATFASNSLPAGLYSLVVTAPTGGSATLTNAFQATTAGAPNFASSLYAPPIVRPSVPATAYAVYNNSGSAAMPAPLLVLTAQQNGVQGAFLGLDASMLAQGVWTTAQQPLGFNHSAQFLASGQTPGRLQPGEAFSEPVYWAGWEVPLGGHTFVNWNLGYITADNPTPVDWSSLEASMQPTTIPSDAWQAIFAAFTNQVGTTWGGYVTTLDNNAYYLGQLGINVQDVNKLLAFQLMQADGLCPVQTLASSVDASVPAPGLPLTFSRSFGERISQRYALGPLGRGWSYNWQYSLQQGSDGTVTITGPGGSQRIFQPDRRGGYFNQAGDYGTVSPAGGGAYTLTEKSGLLYYYQANGSLGYIQDLNNNRITLGYTGGLLTSLTHSSGQYVQIGYNGASLIQTVTDQFDHQTILTYDPANQHLIGAQYFDGRTATYTYITNGLVTQLHALTGSATSCCNWRYFSYDPLGRLTGTALSDNAEAISLSYGSGGQVNVTDALTNTTQFFYDQRGLLAKTEDALDNLVQRSFDNNYNLVSVTDPAGKSYNYGYDSLGNLTQSTDPLNGVSLFTYTTAFNRLASVTDAKQNTTQYGYDSKGNLQAITYANNSLESWTYDSFGNPQSWTNRRGHQTAYTNNVNGQITDKHFVDGPLTSYRYDSQGNLTNATTFDTNQSPLELSTMIYDGSNRLAQITYPGGKFLNFTYDSNDRRMSSTDQLGHSLYYYYDNAGRLTSMTNELNELVVLYQYDPTGRIATKTLGNGMFTTYHYDPAGQVLGLTNALASGALLSYFNYVYDSRGRRTSMASLEGQWTYGYDDIGQLTHAVFATATTNIPNQDLLYVYDAVGNRIQTVENGVTTSYVANNLNQYVSVGTTNYTFDADGNLIQEDSVGGTTTNQYNDENRLVTLTSPQGNWQYTYDALENRSVVTANGTQTRYVIDPVGFGNIVGEYNSNANIRTHYDYGFGLLSRTDSSGIAASYTFDAMGNVQQLTSDSEAETNRYWYAPFGSLLGSVTPKSDPFQFNGESGVVSESRGLSFMRARYYSAADGRFIGADPINLLGGDMNLYRYAENNVLDASDPRGTFSIGWSTLGFEETVGYDPKSGRIVFCAGGTAGVGGNVLVGENGSVSASFDLGESVGISLSTDTPTPGFYANNWAGVGAVVGAGGAQGQGGSFSGGLGFGAGSSVGYCWNIPWQLLLPPQAPPPNPGTNSTPSGSGSSQNITPGDPNQLTGPAGFAMQNYVINSSLFDYEISFENETNATAPAQIVQITDPLSVNLNWQTFQLTEIAFGDTFIPIPPNTQHFQTNMPFAFNGVNFEMQIEAGINLATGQVFANFFSIDPDTGLPPEGNTGFLPPEDGTGRGMGQFSYTIRPQPGLPEGTVIPSVAYIRFDDNPVIATDQVNDEDPSQGIDTNKQAIVTIDNSNPYSSVTSPYVSTNASFTVCWSGTNNGPAIVSYDIYVSTNNGSWNLWLLGTTNNCADFQGQAGNSYGFYSVAHDGAGIVQQIPGGANTITIVAPHLPPQFGGVPNYFITVGQLLTFTNFVQDPSLPIRFSLGASAPEGAAIDTNGIFTWTPSCAQASTTNLITIWATDSYTIPLSNSVSFVVGVGECLQVGLGSTVLQVGTTSTVPVNIISTLDLTNLSFTVAYPTNRFTNWVMTVSNNAIGATSIQPVDSSKTAFNLAASGGQTFKGPAVIGSLAFQGLPGISMFAPLSPTNVVGSKTDGSIVGNSGGVAGRAVLIGREPLVEAWLGSNSMRMLTLYGNPGSSYQTLFNTNLLATNWLKGQRFPMTNLYQYVGVDQSSPLIYYRAWEFFADPPILEFGLSTSNNLMVLLYGKAGTNYVLESATSLAAGGAWFSTTNITLTNSFQFLNESGLTNNMMFFRAKRP